MIAKWSEYVDSASYRASELPGDGRITITIETSRPGAVVMIAEAMRLDGIHKIWTAVRGRDDMATARAEAEAFIAAALAGLWPEVGS